jgi:hypothetical protein
MIEGDRRPLDRQIAEYLDEAVEVRSYLNNSGFMQWYYDKYGYKRFEFLAYKNQILFVVVLDKGRKVVVTCVNAKTHLAGRQVMRPKFGRKKRREQDAHV